MFLYRLDDPLMWGIKGFKCDPKKARWTLAAEDICFTNPVFSYFFRLGQEFGSVIIFPFVCVYERERESPCERDDQC